MRNSVEVWCSGLDSNQHGFYSAATSRLCVYQFRHPSAYNKTPCTTDTPSPVIHRGFRCPTCRDYSP